MKPIKCFSLKANEDSINWFVSTECQTYASPDSSVKRGQYITCRLTKLNTWTQAPRSGFSVRGTSQPQGPILTLDEAKAIGLLPEAAWDAYLQAIKQENTNGRKSS